MYDEPVPLVIVEGFLGGGSRILWGDFERHLHESSEGKDSPQRRVFFAKVGPVSSLHDRACELYYDIVGGTVDYGEQHSSEHSHKRYGRTSFRGQYPQWSKEHPLHFLGHSMGGATITKLQYLLRIGHFGPDSGPDMLLSVTSVSAPFRGTQAVYTLGERVDAAPLVRTLSIGDILSKMVHVGAYLSPLLPYSLDIWRLEARSFALHETSLVNFIKQVWKSDFARSHDAAPYDVTFVGADAREANSEGEPNQKTFYRSYAAVMTLKSAANASNTHAPSLRSVFSSTPLYILSRSIGKFDFATLSPQPMFLKSKDGKTPSSPGEEHWANDGVVPLFSQWHPLDCSSTRCHHHPASSGRNSALRLIIEPGIWHVQTLEETTHTSLVPLWLSTPRQRLFWGEYGQWLTEIDIYRLSKV